MTTGARQLVALLGSHADISSAEFMFLAGWPRQEGGCLMSNGAEQRSQVRVPPRRTNFGDGWINFYRGKRFEAVLLQAVSVHTFCDILHTIPEPETAAGKVRPRPHTASLDNPLTKSASAATRGQDATVERRRLHAGDNRRIHCGQRAGVGAGGLGRPLSGGRAGLLRAGRRRVVEAKDGGSGPRMDG